MPEEKKASKDTAEIVQLLKDWKPVGLEGLAQKLKDAQLASKSATQDEGARVRRKPAQKDRIDRRIAEIKEKIGEEERRKQEIEDMLKEYEEETTEEAPAGGGTNAPVSEL